MKAVCKIATGLFLIIGWLGNHLVTQAQPTPSVPTALTWMTISFEEDLYLTMDVEPKTVMALSLHQPDIEAEMIMYESFELIRDIIASETGLEILPHQTLKDKVTYSRLGYPVARLKKAAKNSDFDQFVKVDILVSGAKRTTRETSEDILLVDDISISEGYSEVNLLPQVDVTLHFAGGDGKSTGKFRGRYRHMEKLLITTESLQAGSFSIPLKQAAEPIPYYYYLHKAIFNLVEQLPD